MRILIADDNERIRRGIIGILASDVELEVCGEAENSSETISQARGLKPDCILLDMSMPGGANGFETARLLRKEAPNAKIIIISEHSEELLASFANAAGAHAMVTKMNLDKDLIPAIHSLNERAKDHEHSAALR